MTYLSFALDINDWPVLIVGAGNRVAGRRARLLIGDGAQVVVVAPEIGTTIAELETAGALRCHRRFFFDEDISACRLVVAATDDAALNRHIVRLAEEHGILSNCASSGRDGRLLFPARYRSRGVEVAVHDQGGSVRRVLHIRDRIAGQLEASGALTPPVPPPEGLVYLVGAGPGAPDLLTLRALRAMQRADLIIVDKILGADFLERLDLDLRGKEVVRLGGGTDSPTRQRGINERLVAEARRGLVIARVKNGDPLVFGRGGEEADYLNEHQVRWEFVPGLSSSISLLTNAGFGVTNRGSGRSFAVVSARLAGGALNQRLPRADSLIVLMGHAVLPQIREQLVAEGWDPATPAAIVERGGLPFERRLQGRLDDIVERAAEAQVASPAIVAIGAAAATCYHSIRRPLLLFCGPDPAPYRALGDLLHWPTHAIDSAETHHADFGRSLPDCDGICLTATAQADALQTHYGDEILHGRSCWLAGDLPAPTWAGVVHRFDC